MIEDALIYAGILSAAVMLALIGYDKDPGAWILRMFLITILAAFLGLSLTGCTTLQEAGDTKLNVSRKAISAAEWELCHGASVGAIRERYGVSSGRISAWRQLCAAESNDLFNNQ